MNTMVAGIDIGYSNTKRVSGPADGTVLTLEQGVHPSCAVARENAGTAFGAGGGGTGAVEVMVDDEVWMAFADPEAASKWTRTISTDYPLTPAYLALYRGALAQLRVDRVSAVVTGLPVSQIADQKLIAAMRSRMTGPQRISPGRTVHVDQLAVIPQPIGGFLDATAGESPGRYKRTLVLDLGFFSLDYVTVANQSLVKDGSGSSTEATSRIIEEVVAAINAQYPNGTCMERVEDTLRQGRQITQVKGRDIDLSSHLAKATRSVLMRGMAEIRAAMRSVKASPDRVLLVGGGAELCRPYAQEVFDDVYVVTAANSVLSNARGFWRYGAKHTLRAAA